MSDDEIPSTDVVPAEFEIPESLLDAFRISVYASPHLRARQYLALIAAGIKLARKIDAWDVIVEWATEHADEHGGRPAVPQNDNVSISAFAKICDQLGITPVSTRAMRAEAGPPRQTTKRGGDDEQSAGSQPGRVSSITDRRERAGRPA